MQIKKTIDKYIYVSLISLLILNFNNRHFTREALPRLDNYRNIMSIQAAYRPTLDELHNASFTRKVSIYIYIYHVIVKF